MEYRGVQGLNRMMFRLPQQRALRKLIRVIPVAQTQIHEGISVTVTSLDCYERGFDVHMYLWRDVDDGLLDLAT